MYRDVPRAYPTNSFIYSFIVFFTLMTANTKTQSTQRVFALFERVWTWEGRMSQRPSGRTPT